MFAKNILITTHIDHNPSSEVKGIGRKKAVKRKTSKIQRMGNIDLLHESQLSQLPSLVVVVVRKLLKLRLMAFATGGPIALNCSTLICVVFCLEHPVFNTDIRLLLLFEKCHIL